MTAGPGKRTTVQESGKRERHGSDVFEVALAFKGDAFRVVYAVQLPEEIWVAFQKKSMQGMKTP
jgi:phage-related protein